MKEKSHMCILTSKGKMPKTKYIMLTVVFSHLRWCCWTKQDTLCATIAQHVQHITDAQQKNWTQQSFKAHVTTSASISTISSTFNFLFKVLFIFPSRYLCAISLKLLFIFQWNLPPSLHFIPEKCESTHACSTQEHMNGTKEYHPYGCSVPRSTHSMSRWQNSFTLHVKA